MAARYNRWMVLSAFVVDAFASEIFRGNPAAIVPLQARLPNALLQSIAAEHNLAETAYFVREDSGYHLRWFTPAVEVDLCGHATVAAAFVMRTQLGFNDSRVVFASKSGPLGVDMAGDTYTLDFPARPPQPVVPDAFVVEGLGRAPLELLAARDYFAVYDSEATLAALAPDFGLLKKAQRFAVIATAPSSQPGVDFVSRFFAPAQGIDEDPVTGSAHSTLIPCWSARLGKTGLIAKQISPRGGDLTCELRGERVGIGGRAVLYSKNEIYIPG
jgi:predicted PhzF superfamily epimerase YddE/YHI9